MSDTAARLDILIDIQAKLDSLMSVQRGMKETKAEASALGSLFRTGLGIGSGMELARRGVDLFKAAMRESIGEAFALAGAIKDQAENLNISTDAYQVLAKVIKDAGGGMETLTQLISINNRSLAEARTLSGSAANAYRTLGLDPAQLEGLAVERRLESIGRAIIDAKDQTAAYGAAASILGSRNLPMLIGSLRNLAADGYDKAAESARKFGQVMERDTIKRLDEAEKAIERLKRKITTDIGEGIAGAGMIVQSARKDAAGTFGGLLKAIMFGDYTALALTMGDTLGDQNKRQKEQDAQEEAERRARERAAMIEIARKNSLANAELLVTTSQINREEIENDPLVSSRIERRRQTIAAIEKEVAARFALIDVLRATPLEDTNDTAQTRAAKLAKMRQEATGLNRRGTDLSIGGTSMFSGIRDAYLDRDRAENSMSPMQGLNAGFMQFSTQVGSTGQQIASTISGTIGGAVSTLSDGIQGLITGTKTWGDVGRSAGSMFLQALIQLGVQMAINWAIGKVIGTEEKKQTKENTAAKGAEAGMKSIAQLGPIWGTLAFAASLAAIFAMLGGFREKGGPVSAGVPYVVGEKRAEVFVPNQSGMIVPSVGEFSRTSPGLTASAAVGASKPRLYLMRPSTEQDFEAMRRLPEWDVHVVDSVMRRRGEILNT